MGKRGGEMDAAAFGQMYEAFQDFHAYFGPLFVNGGGKVYHCGGEKVSHSCWLLTQIVPGRFDLGWSQNLVNLNGVNAKINRARECLQSLESDIEVFCADRRPQLIREAQQEIHIIRNDPPELLVDYSIRSGEIAYNLRSALDHIVQELVYVNGETPSSRNEFPIFREQDKYCKKAKAKLKGINQRHRELIDSFQPYQERGGVGTHLWMLNSICKIDKHRYLNVVNLHSCSTAHIDEDVDPALTQGQTGGLGLLTRLRGTGQEDKVKIDVATDVCFRDDELENASVGYGSEMEREDLKRPPVALALSCCLAAVKIVVHRLASETHTG